jgi:hypothetical protein
MDIPGEYGARFPKIRKWCSRYGVYLTAISQLRFVMEPHLDCE